MSCFTSLQCTTQTKTTVLTYMFALCLRVDDYATDSALIASDLAMPVAKYVIPAYRLLPMLQLLIFVPLVLESISYSRLLVSSASLS